MSYTPVELRHVRVGRRLFGYDRASVEQILSDVADSFEIVWRDRGELADKVEALERAARRAEAPRAGADEHARRRRACRRRGQGPRQARGGADRRRGTRRGPLDPAHGPERARAAVRRVARIEALLRSALGIVERRPRPPTGRRRRAEAPRAPGQPRGRELAAEPPSEPTSPRPSRPRREEQPGWPPLRRVAGDADFDWGD